MSSKERFLDAARFAASHLDDEALDTLTVTVNAHLVYRSQSNEGKLAAGQQRFGTNIGNLARALALEANGRWVEALDKSGGDVPHQAPDDPGLAVAFAEIISAHSGKPAAGEKAE